MLRGGTAGVFVQDLVVRAIDTVEVDALDAQVVRSLLGDAPELAAHLYHSLAVELARWLRFSTDLQAEPTCSWG